ncbi:MAG: xylose isomerase [Isosphaeraceae bacterium]|jgi:sugar phosphate isomerase/epimerase|nr:MAG: xylose isomerase [Isosphaeraceae bacterium]
MDGFPLCLNTSTIQPTPLLEKIHIAGRLGYDAIEPWIGEIDAFAERGSLGELRRIITDAGLHVASVIAVEGWLDSDPSRRTAALDECRRRMDSAAALGCPFLVATPPDQPVETDRAVDAYARLLDLGRHHSIRPALEFLGFAPSIKTLDSALAIARATGNPDACVVADVFHLLRGGGSLDDLLQLKPGELAIFHINDLPASPPFLDQSDSDRVLPGDGVVDLPRVISHLRTVGYNGPLSLELFNKELWKQPPEDVARRGLERLQKLLD